MAQKCVHPVPPSHQPLSNTLTHTLLLCLLIDIFFFLTNLYVMAAAGEPAEPLKYQTWVLKVSIHCEGCRRSVKKALQSIDGVYKTTVDAQQHKVTVTGNVPAEKLIKKLLKSGKHAELWPEKKPANNQSSSPTNGSNNSKKKNKNKGEASGLSEQPDNRENKQATSNTPKKPNKPDGETPKSAAKQPSDREQNDSDRNGNASSKKGKKPNNRAAAAGGSEGGVEEVEKASGGGGAGMSLPRQPPAYHLPMYPAAPPPPAYIMSYNTSHPPASYGAAYYPLPVQHSGYIYSAAYPTSGSYYAPEILSSPSVAAEEEIAGGACTVM